MNSSLTILGLVLSLMTANGALATQYPQQVQVIDPDKTFLHAFGKSSEYIVDHVSSVGYELYGPAGLKAQLDSMGVKYAEPDQTETKILADYPTAEATVAKMQELQKKYPTLITLMEIGKTVEGRSLMFAKLTAPANRGSAMNTRPEFKYIANMHGDEIVGRELMIALIEDLAKNYGKDDRITRVMDSIQIFIMPSMNPDGATHKVRFNAHGTDLNRSFPDFTTSDNVNTAANREPEIQAIMKFQAQHHFKLSANFHGGSQVVNYPWDTTQAPHPLDNLVRTLSLDYAKRVPYIYNSSEFTQGITNGFAWYEVDGGMQDWSYNWYKDLQVTIELTNVKWPAYSSVAATYAANRDGLLAYIEDIAQVK